MEKQAAYRWNNKLRIVVVTLVSILLWSLLVISGVSVKASQDLTNNEDTSEKIVSTEQSILWSEERVNALASELKELHPELSYDYLKDGVYEQLIDNGGSNSNTNNAFRRGGWQGITVAQAGAAIDTAIGIAVGGGAGAGLRVLLMRKGKHEAIGIVKRAAQRHLPWISEGAIDIALNYLSPGTYLAKWWDSRDKYPNNGRINI
ncbi:hypothetical protein [Lactobacillus taiwanensis]|uniref:hypothetical protein n=1 Tax=Lactobacillus taiwanensis TaxID=508451 RepID=UPI00321FEB0B